MSDGVNLRRKKEGGRKKNESKKRSNHSPSFTTHVVQPVEDRVVYLIPLPSLLGSGELGPKDTSYPALLRPLGYATVRRQWIVSHHS